MKKTEFETIVGNHLFDKDYNKQLVENYRTYDRFLFKIHQGRSIKLARKYKESLINFLQKGYTLSGDVRYLNELFYIKDVDDSVINNVQKAFELNTDDKGFHKLPPHPKGSADESFYELDTFDIKRIGLLGPPHFFTDIYKRLKEKGYEVIVINIPYNSEPIRNIVLKNKIARKIYERKYKVDIPYLTLPLNPNSKELGEELKKMSFDIGFSRLGFIVRDNIFNQFKYGLIHDHGAKLPDFRGRSVMEYTLLHGKKVTGTIHYIDKGIDTGDVLMEKYYQGLYEHDSIEDIKKFYRKDFTDRVNLFFERIQQGKIQVKENIFKNGKTWYSIHPKLKKYINKRILQNEDFDPFT